MLFSSCGYFGADEEETLLHPSFIFINLSTNNLNLSHNLQEIPKILNLRSALMAFLRKDSNRILLFSISFSTYGGRYDGM